MTEEERLARWLYNELDPDLDLDPDACDAQYGPHPPWESMSDNDQDYWMCAAEKLLDFLEAQFEEKRDRWISVPTHPGWWWVCGKGACGKGPFEPAPAEVTRVEDDHYWVIQEAVVGEQLTSRKEIGPLWALPEMRFHPMAKPAGPEEFGQPEETLSKPEPDDEDGELYDFAHRMFEQLRTLDGRQASRVLLLLIGAWHRFFRNLKPLDEWFAELKEQVRELDEQEFGVDSIDPRRRATEDAEALRRKKSLTPQALKLAEEFLEAGSGKEGYDVLMAAAVIVEYLGTVLPNFDFGEWCTWVRQLKMANERRLDMAEPS